jgi:hypothetical protein
MIGSSKRAHKEHRLARGFLSRTREEREFELYEAKITAQSEDNESLQSQLSELTRTHNASKEQITKLQEGRTKWQQKCLSMMAKRPREEDVEPGLAKRAAENHPDPAPATSEDVTMSSTDVIPSSVGPSHTSNTSDTSNTSNTINTSHTSSSRLPSPPWGAPLLPVEISDRRKEKFKRDYDLDFDPWGPGLTIEDEAEATLKMWKAQVRKGSRYVPDYHESKLQRYSITHEGNIKVGVRAKEDFNRSTATFTYFQKVEERHEGYIMFQRRNYIPRRITNYWRILNDPPLAALERCVPVSHYYSEICEDSPGYIPPQHQSFNHGHGSSGSGHSGQDNHRTSQVKSSRTKFTNHASSRHNSSHTNHNNNKSASCSRYESRSNSA